MLGIEKIVDLILDFLWDLLPFYVVNEWQQVVVLRFGKLHRVRAKGIHWIIPYVEEAVTYNTITTTMETSAQTIVTIDGVEITTQSVIKYSIDDVVKYTTEIYDAIDAIIDITQGHVANQVNTHTYEECRDTAALSNEIAKKVRNEVKRYGVAIEAVTLVNFVKTRNYRLFNEATA